MSGLTGGTPLADLERYIHSDPEAPGQLPPLVRIGLIHAQFETIHPFHDGNGRIGRLLITLLLCEQRLLGQPALYLSHFFRANRLEYYERLQAIRDRGDWEGWVRFFLRGVAIVAREAADVARNIILLREDYRNKIAGSYGAQAAKAFTLLDYFFRTPYITAKKAQSILKVSYKNANYIVRHFEKDGIITNMFGIHRNRIFVFDPYLNLFRAIGSST